MAVLSYLAICVFWGLSSIATKIGLQNIEPFTFSFLRFLTTGTILLIYNLLRKKSIRLQREDFKVIAISAVIMYFLNTIFTMFATRRLDAGIIPILFALVPVVMVILETIIGRKMLVGIPGIIGIFGGIAGIFFVSMGDRGGESVDLFGLILMMCAVLAWSSGSVYLRNKKINASLTTLIMYQMLVPLSVYTVLIVKQGGPIIYEWNLMSFLGMFYMAIIDGLIGGACYVYLLKRWKVSVVATYAYVNPVVGLLGSFWILGESITMQKVIGMAIILLSVFLIQSDGSIRKYFGNNYGQNKC